MLLCVVLSFRGQATRLRRNGSDFSAITLLMLLSFTTACNAAAACIAFMTHLGAAAAAAESADAQLSKLGTAVVC